MTTFDPKIRQTGIAAVGEAPWGTHFCQFYATPEDLTDVLVPYFKAGLEADELCMWVTSPPLGTDAAWKALARVVPDLDSHRQRGRIEILPHTEWYLLGGRFDRDRVLAGWIEKLRGALGRGCAGLRLSGNTFWLERSDWQSFANYEAAIDATLGQHRMLALCTYSLDRCGAGEIADVIKNHQFALLKRDGAWERIESFDRRRAGEAAEERLRESEARYRSLFNGMTEGFAIQEIVADESGEPAAYRFLDVNPAFERLTGLRGENLLGRTLNGVLPGENSCWLIDFARVVRTGVPVQFEASAPTLNRYFEVFAFRSAPGQLAVILRDISDSKRSEVALRRSESRLRLLSRTAGRLLAAADPQSTIDDLCREVMQHLDCQLFFNFLADESSGRLRLHACAGISAEETHRIERLKPGASICGCVAQERRRRIVEDVLRSTDPRTDLIRSYGVQAYCCHPLMAEDRLLGTLSFGTRTRTRFAEDEVELMQTVAAQVATAMEHVRSKLALSRANVQLVEADRRKNEFLAMLSHELRNPLAPIQNSLYILEHALPGGEQAQRAQQVIGRQVKQLANLVNDLLDITRISRNKIQLQRERLDLVEVVRRTVDDHRAGFERDNVRVEVTTSPVPVLVNADRTRMAQVVGNLLQNAAKFTLAGGRVSVWAGTEDGQAIVRVVDDGVGMAPETITRLFQPFMQADESLERSKGGLGLGLALVKGLVELHGGSIHAQSEGLGKGSDFVVRLPLETDAALPAGGARAERSPARQRVLIIEDNVDAAESLREVLEIQEHEVAVAYDGPEGVAKARAFKPDLILCDIGLPGMDGYQVARVLRTDEAFASTRLVALSGYALPEDQLRAREVGFDQHLAKPPTVEMLQNLLQSPR